MQGWTLFCLLSVCAANVGAGRTVLNPRIDEGSRSVAKASSAQHLSSKTALSDTHAKSAKSGKGSSTIASSSVQSSSHPTPKSQKSNANKASAGKDSNAAGALSSAGIQPASYKDPTGPVVNVLAVGDSYTAGIGSNGKPDLDDGSSDCLRYNQAYPRQLVQQQDWKSFNGDKLPTLTFGACSGATSKAMRDKQLKQGTPNPHLEYTNIGKPTMAVLTIGGNDVGFSDIIDYCIARNNNEQACLDRLGKAEDEIKGQDFQSSITLALVNLIAAGRQAGGATPPESFQVYMTGYIQFWNDQDAGCDQVSWGWWWYSGKLTRTIRHRMNSVTDLLNGVLKDLAGELHDAGVFWVDPSPIQQKFDGHRYCEKAPQDTQKAPCGADTWFWHWDCNSYLGGGEGDVGKLASSQAPNNVSEEILEALIPDRATRAKIGPNYPPQKVNQTEFATLDSIEQALEGSANASMIPLSPNTKRAFHPKGTAYGVFAQNFLSAIKANRKQKADSTTAPTAPSYAPGVCCFHIDQYDTCNDADKQAHDLFANITLVDANKKTIYQSKADSGDKGLLGDSINNGDGFTIKSVLPNALGMTAEHEYDYIQFKYGSLSWTSSDHGKTGGWCDKGGWDPRDGPVCPKGKKSLGDVPQNGIPAERQMDCCFPC